MKFFFKDFFSKCDQIIFYQQIWSYLPQKIQMKNFIFYTVETKTHGKSFQ